MILVNAYLDKSKTHVIEVFAGKKIEKGTRF